MRRHAYGLVLILLVFLVVSYQPAQAVTGSFEYGERLAGDLELVGPIAFGDGTVGAAAMFNMTTPRLEDETYLKRAGQVACEVLVPQILNDVREMRPGEYSILAIIFKWVGEEKDGVAPILNYSSVFNVEDCSHIGKNH